MTDQELKHLLDSFPVSPGIIRLQCLKCGDARTAVLAIGETLEQAREKFADGHNGHCRAVTGHAIPHTQG